MAIHLKILLQSFLILLLTGYGFSPLHAEESKLLRHVSATECKSCHEDIYAQWQDSMHAHSTALKDPIHGAFYKKVIGDPTQEGIKKAGKYPICLQCHAPAAAKDGKTDLTAKPVYSEGVNCVACHTLTKFKGTNKVDGGLRLGIQAYEYSDSSLQGSGINRTTADWQHPIFDNTANPNLLKTNAVCMGCHDKRNNANKVPLCQTGDEIATSDNSSNCLTCHMPIVNGQVSHRLLGGHSAKMVSKGLSMTMSHSLSSHTNKLEVVITLANQLPHNLPTGAPFRNIYIILTGHDHQGNAIWKSSQSHPMKDDKSAMLMYRLGDANGQPSSPPKATQVLGDTRLKPYETRQLHYNLPTQGIAKLRAVAYYDLLLPPMKQNFTQPEHQHLTTSKMIAVSELMVKQ